MVAGDEIKWLDPESNRGHEDFQSSALPTELSSRKQERYFARDPDDGKRFSSFQLKLLIFSSSESYFKPLRLIPFSLSIH
jgi:hypothetical protein